MIKYPNKWWIGDPQNSTGVRIPLGCRRVTRVPPKHEQVFLSITLPLHVVQTDQTKPSWCSCCRRGGSWLLFTLGVQKVFGEVSFCFSDWTCCSLAYTQKHRTRNGLISNLLLGGSVSLDHRIPSGKCPLTSGSLLFLGVFAKIN